MSRDEQRQIVERGTILRGTVGSTVHGLHHGGQDDRDEMAIFLEPPEFLIGLRLARSPGGSQPFEHYVERTQPEGARSGPGVDLPSRGTAVSTVVVVASSRRIDARCVGSRTQSDLGPVMPGFLRRRSSPLVATNRGACGR